MDLTVPGSFGHRARLAGHEQPRRVIVVPGRLPARTTTGKLPREALEKWVAALPASGDEHPNP